MAPDGDETFKVTDRRRRGDAEEPSPRVVSPPEAETRSQPSTSADVSRSPQYPEGRAAPPDHRHERTLVGLFVMLASSAAFALGEAPDPATGQVHQDLQQAGELVDLLVLLREKTEGNRTAQETQILDDLVYDLQLRYVSATRSSAGRPAPSRS